MDFQASAKCSDQPTFGRLVPDHFQEKLGFTIGKLLSLTLKNVTAPAQTWRSGADLEAERKDLDLRESPIWKRSFLEKILGNVLGGFNLPL